MYDAFFTMMKKPQTCQLCLRVKAIRLMFGLASLCGFVYFAQAQQPVDEAGLSDVTQQQSSDQPDSDSGEQSESRVFEYTGSNKQNPFVPTGALAREMGMSAMPAANTAEQSQSSASDSPATNASNGSSSEAQRESSQPAVEVANIVISSPPVSADNAKTDQLDSDFRYVGRLKNQNGAPVALLSAPDGLLYHAGVGEYIGSTRTFVRQIDSGQLVISNGQREIVLPLSSSQ